MAYQQQPHDQQQYHQQQQQAYHQQQQHAYQQAPPQGYTPSPPAQQIQQYAPPAQQQQYQQHQQQQLAHQPQQHPTHVQQVVHQQYQGQQQMQPQYAQVGNPKGWQNGLMDCSPCGSCCLATWLPCILLGQTSERQRDQTLATYETFNQDCLMFCGIQALTGCGWIYVMMKRTEIREKFGIEGDGTGDCCVSYWCACCALIQQDKEVEARMPPGHASTQGYQAQAGMQVPQPAKH